MSQMGPRPEDTIPALKIRTEVCLNRAARVGLSFVGGDGLVVPSWLALCWIAQGSGLESQRGHLFLGISPRGEISQEGFVQGLVSPPATGRYIGSVRIISEAPLVCPNGC
jgi:hypothetical protein